MICVRLTEEKFTIVRGAVCWFVSALVRSGLSGVQ